RHERRRKSHAASVRRRCMTDATYGTHGVRAGFGPRAVGLSTLLVALLLAEVLIRAGLVNRFIVPPPSEVINAFKPMLAEDLIFRRFRAPAGECLVAGILLTVVGVAFGVLMHRYTLLQRAIETWIAAVAAAPLVIMYPLFLVVFGRNAMTIIMMGFIS